VSEEGEGGAEENSANLSLGHAEIEVADKYEVIAEKERN